MVNFLKQHWKFIAVIIGLITLITAQILGQYCYNDKKYPYDTVIIVLYALSILLLLPLASLIPSTEKEIPRKYKIIALLAMIGFAALARFSFINTASLGYNGESLNFFKEADVIYRTGRLQPFVGYFHMGLSYLVAEMMFITGKGIFTFRFTHAVISFLTIIFFYLWIKESISFRSAILGSVFLSASVLHLLHSRDGYPHALLLMWQALAFWLMFLTIRTRNTYYAIGMAFALGCGLNTNWGFYYTPALLALFLLYKVITQRAFLKEQHLNITVAVLITGFMVLPFYLQYTKFGAQDFSRKYLSWALGTKEKTLETKLHDYADRLKKDWPYALLNRQPVLKYYQFRPMFDIFVGYLCLVGLAVCVVKFKHQGYFYLAMLAPLSVLANIMAINHYSYTYPLIMPYMALAGVGFESLWKLLESRSRLPQRVVRSVFISIVVAYAGFSYYDIYFGDRYFTMYGNNIEYAGYQINRLVHNSKADQIYTHIGDLHPQTMVLAKIAKDARMRSVKPIDSYHVIFPKDDFIKTPFVEVIVSALSRNSIYDTLQQLYPDGNYIAISTPVTARESKKMEDEYIFRAIISQKATVSGIETLKELDPNSVIWVEGEELMIHLKKRHEPDPWRFAGDIHHHGFSGSGYLISKRTTTGRHTLSTVAPRTYNIWIRYWKERFKAKLEIGDAFVREFSNRSTQKDWLWEQIGTVDVPAGEIEVRYKRLSGDVFLDAIVLIEDKNLEPDDLLLSMDNEQVFLKPR